MTSSGIGHPPCEPCPAPSCPEELWGELEPLFRRAVDSFVMLPTTRDYIPPDKDPWLFF